MAYTEVYTALQQHIIDGCQAGLPSYSVGHQEVTKWVALLRENLTLVPFTVSETWWKTLPQEAKDIITQAQEETELKVRTLDQRMDGDLQKKWAKAGAPPYKPNREAFEAKAKQLYPEYKKMLKDDQWFDWIVKVGDKYPIAELKY
jgi:TRAP-type C4-dicarboxylate transport system substrate-binding protein